MRLNRRKNRDSESDRRRPRERSSESTSEDPPRPREKHRSSLAGGVRSLRDGRRRLRSAGARRLRPIARFARSTAADALGIAREILRWPARVWMAVAEALGSALLAAWRIAVVPAWRLALRLLRAGLALGERTVTPARALTVVALAATIALGGSQFGDYRAVQVGAPGYSKVQDVAQAPEVASAMPSSAHGIWVFAIAVACLFVTLFAVWRNWRLARLLLFAGVAVVAVSLLVDRPEGLRLGTEGVAYSGAHAVLLGCFWAQLFSGVTLIVVGPLLAAQLRREQAPRRRRSRPGRRGDGAESKRVPRLRPGVGT